MKRTYKAIAFDVDGTLTKFAHFTIPNSMIQTLNKIPTHIPLAICTGRPLNFIQGKLNAICSTFTEDRKRWFVISENGSNAFKYNVKTDDYDKLWEIPWPHSKVKIPTLEAFIKDRFGRHVSVVTRPNGMVVRYPDWMYLFPKMVKIESYRTARGLRKLLKEMELDEILVTMDSGLGSIIIPKESGKGQAIEKWARHMKIDLKDILCIGDRADLGGNDEDFLSGDYGTAFTVGALTENVYPLPVLDKKNKKLSGPKGTESLLAQLILN